MYFHSLCLHIFTGMMQETSQDKFVALLPINIFIKQLSGPVKKSFFQDIILPPSQ